MGLHGLCRLQAGLARYIRDDTFRGKANSNQRADADLTLNVQRAAVQFNKRLGQR